MKNIYQNFIYLTGKEKKFLVYLIDYFFKTEYAALRNIILESLYKKHNIIQKERK